MPPKQPNVVVVFADQMRARATGYAGDPNVKTPVMDGLASESVNFSNAVGGCPVCSPYRASLITGQYPLTHGIFLNDLYLEQNGSSIAHCFKDAGYDTAYVGKWHLDGHGRSSYIPRERRQGFDYWKVLECTHSYNDSKYYDGDDPQVKTWDGYDAHAQTRDAIRYLETRESDKPVLLFLSWGPPHSPYLSAAPEFRSLYDPERLVMPPNVPEDAMDRARETLAGYYAHITAIDTSLGWLLKALDRLGMAEDTILLFTSDHGDMVGSRGAWDKQRPYDESVRVPFLLRWPAGLGHEGRVLQSPIDAPDIMPTLLSLCGIPIPDTVDGLDFADYTRGRDDPGDGAALLQCPSPFGNWPRQRGGREYRGVRTSRYTYVRDLNGPWLLYDNETDPFQLDNLVDRERHAELQRRLDGRLDRKLAERDDRFLPGAEYLKQREYEVDDQGCIVCVHGRPVPGGRGYRDT